MFLFNFSDETEKKQQLLKSQSSGAITSSDPAKKSNKKDKKKKDESKKGQKAGKDERARSRSKGVNNGQTPRQQQQTRLKELSQVNGNPVPLFVEKCTQFIEEEGLDMEGIYRVPGNRAHVDTLLQEFDKSKF